MEKILLLDMDNVLLLPLGYRRALQQAVAASAAALGFSSPDFSDEAVEEIEATGVTSEWEMAAITAAILMANPASAGARLPDYLNLDPASDSLQPAPATLPVFKQIAQLDPTRSAPDRARDVLLADGHSLESGRQSDIEWILDKARTKESVIFRTIQELVLGSQRYAQSYQLPAVLASRSYLDTYDQPILSSTLAECLQEWRGTAGHEAAIFTNRPCTPPAGHFDTPEAELGVELVGLTGVPIIGSGAMGWLALVHGEAAEKFLKPSPFHALSALLAACGVAKAEALTASWNLGEQGRFQGQYWQALESCQVAVFEDSAKGLRSALSAQSILAKHGVHIHLQLFGISQNQSKQKELAALNAQLFPDVNGALRSVLNGCND